MKRILLLTLIVMLTACGKSEPTDTVDSLVAHPDRLRDVEEQCADKYPKMGAAECDAASEARHRLFVGNGAQYTTSKKPPKF